MSPAVILLILRIFGALLLLCFLGLIAWFMYRDIQISTETDNRVSKPNGNLRILSSEIEGVEAGSNISLSVVTGIGRSPANRVVLDDEYVSNNHSLISWNGELWMLEDLGSRNGTLLNNLPIDRQTVIVAGDEITVGRTILSVEFP
jgi:pSer/pThr/pTyr-binding forkhead associated (FHA) protein